MDSAFELAPGEVMADRYDPADETGETPANETPFEGLEEFYF
jgi:hypothetical protein